MYRVRDYGYVVCVGNEELFRSSRRDEAERFYEDEVLEREEYGGDYVYMYEIAYVGYRASDCYVVETNDPTYF